MDRFTVEERNLICIYNTGSRAGLLLELTQMKTHLEEDETELTELTNSVICKINALKDEEFEDIIVDLATNFE